MTHDRQRVESDGRDFRTLPAKARAEETIASVDPGPVPDPDAGRNNAQYDALRDD